MTHLQVPSCHLLSQNWNPYTFLVIHQSPYLKTTYRCVLQNSCFLPPTPCWYSYFLNIALRLFFTNRTRIKPYPFSMPFNGVLPNYVSRSVYTHTFVYLFICMSRLYICICMCIYVCNLHLLPISTCPYISLFPSPSLSSSPWFVHSDIIWGPFR